MPFHITNLAGGSSQSVHELVLLRTDLSPDRLPTTPSGGVDEKASVLDVVGEVENIAPGEGAILEVDLEPGSYLAIAASAATSPRGWSPASPPGSVPPPIPKVPSREGPPALEAASALLQAGAMERIEERTERVDLGTVREVMRQSVAVLDPETSAGEAARLLERAGVAGAPVVRGDRVIGVISRSDLLARAREVSPHAQESGPFLRYEQVLDSSELKVEAVMTPHVVAARVDWPVTVAALTMQAEGVNRLPVLDANDRLVGILARDDVIAAVAQAARSGAGLRPTLPPD